jgi:hypothetical protein
MIRIKAAYGAKTGKMLEVDTRITGGVTQASAISSMGDLLAKFAQHVRFACSGRFSLKRFLSAVMEAAHGAFRALPPADDAVKIRAANTYTGLEAEYRSIPSGEDEQQLELQIAVRANGFSVVDEHMVLAGIPFDELPTAFVYSLGFLAGKALGLSSVPCAIDPNSKDTMKDAFWPALVAALQEAAPLRAERAIAAVNRWRHMLIAGEMDVTN